MGMLLLIANSCKKDDDNGGSDKSFTDSRDGNVYKTVTIGNQVWMAENLKYLPSVVGPGTGSNTTPYYYVCSYDGTNVADAKATSNYSTYGVIYNWPAAATACPTGWSLPSDTQWSEFENYLADNGYNYDGTTGGGREKIAKAMASTSGWLNSSKTGAVGNTDYPEYRNKSGFTAVPNGDRDINGTFGNIGGNGTWWSATVYDASTAWARGLNYDIVYVYRSGGPKGLGFAVRCVKD